MMTVKQLFSTTVVCAASFACQAHAQDPALFPALSDYSDEAVRLHGLATLFPGRVLFEDPKLATITESRVAARVEDLPRAIKYIRLYRLEEASALLTEHRAHSALILDFRFLKSETAAVHILNTFAKAEWSDTLSTIGSTPDNLIETESAPPAERDTPVIVLCNRETAGPFEAALDKLQQTGSIIAVGEPTAGRTGFYRKTAHDAWMLHGEIRPDHATSLVGVGLQPRIQLKIDAEESYLSYHLYEAGTNISQLLRQENHLETESDETLQSDDDFAEPDRILQRGIDIITALQTLEQQPGL